jgi:peptide-methionine (S)-S-oxide reductase
MTLIVAVLLAAACSRPPVAVEPSGAAASDHATSDHATSPPSDHDPAPIPEPGPNQAVAIFAGGCFWCMETDFDALPGVVATTSGYTGGHVAHATYDDVTSETSGHQEAVRVVYDTTKLTYAQVLDWYWHHVDPTDDGGQFCDRGDSYRPVIFTSDDAQKEAAEASKKAIDASGVLPGPIVVRILPAGPFWAAERYHQDYHLVNPAHYEAYRLGCGRDARVRSVWAKAQP